MIIVQKFGGSSVSDVQRIKHVAQLIVATKAAGNDVVVVLSAQGDTTDKLIARALEVNPNPSKRELDMLMATGEQQIIALMAMAIHRLNYAAVSLTGAQAGIITNSRYGGAHIKRIYVGRIRAELEAQNIVIVAGFQATDGNRNIMTLGRGGSDTTAVALAASLNADLCEIYTDVDGIYSADPKVVPGAYKISMISYDEMLELSTLGSKVLHNRSVELAKKYNVPLVVRSSFTEAEGTLVKEGVKVEKTLVSGIAIDREVARVSVIGVKDTPGMAFNLFSLLARYKVCTDIILQSIGRHDARDISFTIARDRLKETLAILEANRDLIIYDHLDFDDKVGKLSVVGAGISTNPQIVSLMFEAIYDAGIDIQMISTSEIKASVLIDERNLDKAANYVHDKFADEEVQE